MAFIRRTEIPDSEYLAQELEGLKAEMPPTVVDWSYDLKDDWSGDPAIFFNITLSDEASKRENLRRTVAEISSKIEESIQPLKRYGMNAYINVRSQSEQAALKEKSFW